MMMALKRDIQKVLSRTSIMLAGTACLAFLSGCTDEDIIQANTSGTANNPGTVSSFNFSLAADNLEPDVYNTANGEFTPTDVNLTVYLGDRNNNRVTDSHTIFFETEYGLIEPSCVTSTGDGTCSVTWSANQAPVSGGPGSDGFNAITAYTIGEESFIDTNGNGTFDDGEFFDDVEEPYVDIDRSFSFTAGDRIIDLPNGLDPSGDNSAHDSGDTLFNGSGCQSSTECSDRTTTFVFSRLNLDLFTTAYRVGLLSVSIPGGTTVTVRLTGPDLSDDKLVTSNTPFFFDLRIEEGAAYTISVIAYSSGPTTDCTVTSASGTVGTTDVQTATLTCI